MNRYSHADRAAMAMAIRLLAGSCGCGVPEPRGACPSARRALSNGYSACHAHGAGASLVLGPTGRVEYRRTRPEGSPATERVALERYEAQIDLDAMALRRRGGPPSAPLPAAFRTSRVMEVGAPRVPFRVPVESPGGIGTRIVGKQVERLPLLGIRIRQHALEHDHCRLDVDRDLGRPIREHEDQIVLAQLETLAWSGGTYELRPGSSLDGLAGLVWRLNGRRPSRLPLDTVITGTHMGMTLLENQFGGNHWHAGCPFYDGMPLYLNMAVLDGLALLHHPGIPHGSAFAVSSAQAPVFLHGPTYVSCADGALKVVRRYGIVEPPRGEPWCPWGVRIGVRGDRGAGWACGK